MLSIALKRLWSRMGLTVLSIVGVTLAVGLVASIPVFSKAVSFVILKKELNEISDRTGRPLFSMRVYVLPSARYPLTVRETEVLGNHIEEAIVNEVGLPLIAKTRHLETTGLVIRTQAEETPYGEPNTFLRGDTNLVVLPNVSPHLNVLQGESMEEASSLPNVLNVWMHKTTADQMGIEPGEEYEIRDLRRGVTIPVRVAGFWVAANPKEQYWFSNPDMGLRGKLLARVEDYQSIVEPALEGQLGFASWYLVLDDSRLAPEQMRDYAEGMEAALKIIGKFLPDTRVDSSPMEALDNAIERETTLTSLLFVFSVPVMGFLLYFLALISTITIRWQRRESAVMVSRGMRSGQLLGVSLIETLIIVGIGVPLGILAGIQLAQLMGYTESFMAFTWREPLPITPTSFNIPMIAVAVIATFLARIWPTLRSSGTSVVSHERRRARAPDKPFWQRFYLDFLLLVPVFYAYRQLSRRGTLVPEALVGEGAGRSSSAIFALAPKFFRQVADFLERAQDPLLFLVPALFTLSCSLLLVRVFPLLMRIGDWLGNLGRGTTFYLAFRQLSRQSSQYVSALLLVITSLSLGAFMASMAVSLDQWLIDQVYYAVGSDVLIKQTTNPDEEGPVSPTEGAWVLPVESYQDVPGVVDAARVGMYPASIDLGGRRSLRGQFIGIDRLDVPPVVFYRSDFAPLPLGELLNRLAQREDAVLVSEEALSNSEYEIGDKVHLRVTVADVPLETDFTIAGTFTYWPTVYEEAQGQTAVIGNLDFLYDQIGATLLHNIWLSIEPDADKPAMIAAVEKMGVFISRWIDARDEIAEEQAKVERVGIFGTLTVGFLAAAVLSGIGLLVYNYASLQERLFRFTILRAVGLSLMQVVGQVSIEYLVLMVYSVFGGAAIGVWASRLFIPFFQAADQNILNPPRLIPLIAWEEIGRISGAFTIALVIAQVAVITAALRRGVFQALRLGDRE